MTGLTCAAGTFQLGLFHILLPYSFISFLKKQNKTKQSTTKHDKQLLWSIISHRTNCFGYWIWSDKSPWAARMEIDIDVTGKRIAIWRSAFCIKGPGWSEIEWYWITERSRFASKNEEREKRSSAQQSHLTWPLTLCQNNWNLLLLLYLLVPPTW